ncbi:MAG TPA: hypothetical protein VMN81_00510 [Vicinamibacterales bacterium]|nr:hypothetical protein [Vicinamibacterales bacterium]
MRMSLSLAAALLAVLTAAASAQQKPDFSGTWVTVSPAEHAGQEETITHTAATLSLGHAASHGGHHAVSYRLDGSESRSTMMSHDEEIISVATASWNGDQLVILRATQYPDGSKIESRMTFALNAEGQLVRELIDTIDGKPQPAVTVVARKK